MRPEMAAEMQADREPDDGFVGEWHASAFPTYDDALDCMPAVGEVVVAPGGDRFTVRARGYALEFQRKSSGQALVREVPA